MERQRVTERGKDNDRHREKDIGRYRERQI